MAKRRRIDIFFILYLTAIVGFVVVSIERDKIDETMKELNKQIVRTFVPPVPMVPESDTLRCFVDADTSGRVIGDPVLYRTKVLVRDIVPEDEITFTLHSVILDGTLSSKDMVSIGTRVGTGEMGDHSVYFPISVIFPRTGVYHLNFTALSSRIHEHNTGEFTYRGISFDTTLVNRDMIKSIEQTGLTLTVVVEDTSLDRPSSMQPLNVGVSRLSISSAVGFEAHNTVTVNLGWANPTVSVSRGGGELNEISRSDRSIEYRWSDTVSSIPDTIEIMARTKRMAGGKDIAFARFAVNGTPPFLRSAPPERLYAGEDINFDISVQGLDDPQMYSWRLYENAGSGEPLLKLEGLGPRVIYRIPNSYADRRLTVDARYTGRRYRTLSRNSHAAAISRFAFPVFEPPTRIEIQLPARAPASATFHFLASRYSDIRFRGEQPVDRLADIQVEVTKQNGAHLETDVWMTRKGEFEFALVNRAAISDKGERVVVRIRIAGSSEQRSLMLY